MHVEKNEDESWFPLNFMDVTILLTTQQGQYFT